MAGVYYGKPPVTPDLVDNLNELIGRLNIPLPFALESPFDLTPGLLLGILESILEYRLPIPHAVRASRDFANKVQTMKIFLGVFEHDVLGGRDVGLSEIDPRRLAAGEEEEEVEFIGELLCWLGREKGILQVAGPSSEDRDAPPSLPLAIQARQRAVSPSTHSTITSGMHSNLSMMPTGLAETDTTVTSIASVPLPPLAHTELPELPELPPVVPENRSSRSSTLGSLRPPRCIHEVEDPSFLLDGDDEGDGTTETSICHCASTEAKEEGDDDDLPPPAKTPLPFRSTGWMGDADESSEIQLYYQRRSLPSASTFIPTGRRAKSYSGLSASELSNSQFRPQSRSPSRSQPYDYPQPLTSESRRIITPHNAPTTEYTLALLSERARLLDQLAKIKGATVSRTPPLVK